MFLSKDVKTSLRVLIAEAAIAADGERLLLDLGLEFDFR